MVFITENADRGGIQGKMLALPDRQPDPAHRKRAQELPVRKQGNRSVHRAEAGQHPIRALGNLFH